MFDLQGTVALRTAEGVSKCTSTAWASTPAPDVIYVRYLRWDNAKQRGLQLSSSADRSSYESSDFIHSTPRIHLMMHEK
jgi:hypothetical protein